MEELNEAFIKMFWEGEIMVVYKKQLISFNKNKQNKNNKKNNKKTRKNNKKSRKTKSRKTRIQENNEEWKLDWGGRISGLALNFFPNGFELF